MRGLLSFLVVVAGIAVLVDQLLRRPAMTRRLAAWRTGHLLRFWVATVVPLFALIQLSGAGALPRPAVRAVVVFVLPAVVATLIVGTRRWLELHPRRAV
jgi:hypothetical protein